MKYLIFLFILFFSAFTCYGNDDIEQLEKIGKEILNHSDNYLAYLESNSQVDVGDLLKSVRSDTTFFINLIDYLKGENHETCKVFVTKNKFCNRNDNIYRIIFSCGKQFDLSNPKCNMYELSFIKEVVGNNPKYVLYHIDEDKYEHFKFNAVAEQIILELEQLKAANFNFSQYKFKYLDLNFKTIIELLNNSDYQNRVLDKLLTDTKSNEFKISGWYFQTSTYQERGFFPTFVFYSSVNSTTYLFRVEMCDCFSTTEKPKYTLTMIDLQ